MTEVQFHVNVPDSVHYACRLLRKAMRKGVRLAVTGPAATLAELDRALWVFEADEFLPHVQLHGDEPTAAQARAPVWLVEDASHGTAMPVLVNIGAPVTSSFEAYPRVIEIVSSDDDDRVAGRQRWRDYLARGCAPVKHEVAA
jgi:DNA polymerase-3 subunit chi